MRNQKKPSWLDWLVQVFKLTGVLTILSFAVVWGGWGLFRFFSPPSAPAPKPPGTYATVDSPEETTEETASASDEDSASVVGESDRTNLIKGNPETTTRTPAESYWDSVSFLDISDLPRFSHLYVAGSKSTVGSQIATSFVSISNLTRFSHSSVAGSEVGSQIATSLVAICDVTPSYVAGSQTPGESSVSLLESPSSESEPTVGSQETTSLFAISEFTPASVSAGSETVGQSSESTEQSQEMPVIAENDTKPESRRTLRLELSEEEKEKNAVLRQSISYKESRIRVTKLLIMKSNSIACKRRVEWNKILTELSGIRNIRAQPAFQELERDKVRVLAGEQASRAKYRLQIRLLEYQIQKDKKNIRELVAIPEEPE